MGYQTVIQRYILTRSTTAFGFSAGFLLTVGTAMMWWCDSKKLGEHWTKNRQENHQKYEPIHSCLSIREKKGVKHRQSINYKVGYEYQPQTVAPTVWVHGSHFRVRWWNVVKPNAINHPQNHHFCGWYKPSPTSYRNFASSAAVASCFSLLQVRKPIGKVNELRHFPLSYGAFFTGR